MPFVLGLALLLALVSASIGYIGIGIVILVRWTLRRRQREKADDEDERISLLSIRRRYYAAHVGAFFVTTALLTTMWCWSRLPSEYVAATEFIAEKIRNATPVSFVLTIYLVEGGLAIMVLAGMLKDWIEKDKKAQQAKDYAEAVEVGRAEGVAVGRAEGVTVGRAEGVEAGRAEGVEMGRAEGVEVGRAEGVAKGSAAMKAYYERKIAALERGEPFDEPPPDPSEL